MLPLLAMVAVLSIGLAVQMTFRELRLKILDYGHGVVTTEAEHIANGIRSLGRRAQGLDFQHMRNNLQVLANFLEDRLLDHPYLTQVEIRDDRGDTLLLAVRDRRTGQPRVHAEPPVGGDQLWSAELLSTTVSLDLDNDVGDVQVGIEADAFQQRLERLRRSLAIKIGVASTIAVIVIIAGAIYLVFLQRKTKRLEQARAAAQRRSYVGLLASGLAHEIRNPLNAMNMNLQMLEEEMLDEGGHDADHLELLESTKNEIKRLEQLVNNFLSYARPARPHFTKVDLNAVLEDTVRFLQVDFTQHSVILQLELEPMLPAVEIDKTQFKQAVMNLLVNARQILRDGGEVVVRTRVGSMGDIVVEIADNGPGIPEEMREKIFEVFYSNRGGGTGLGLPIARQILERHGGRIEVRTVTGSGTTFSLHLPRTHTPVARVMDSSAESESES
jgi:signal transduction histidine kinase